MEAISFWLEAIALRLEAIALRVDAIALRLEAQGWQEVDAHAPPRLGGGKTPGYGREGRTLLLGWRPVLLRRRQFAVGQAQSQA